MPPIEAEQLTERGGELWTLKGQSTTGKDREDYGRLVRVKHYKGSWEVHVGIGPPNQAKSRASAALSADEAEALADVLADAAEIARRHEPS